MQKAIRLITSLIMLCAVFTGGAVEMTWEYSVQVSANVQASPAQIILSWPQDQYMVPNTYTVYRKAPGDTSWGNGTTLPGTTTTYTDSNVSVGAAYEYQIVKTSSLYTGYGYIYSGINVPMTDSRGKLLLLVDNTVSGSLVNELAQLQQDLTGDGWTVLRFDVSRTDSVVNIKNLIKTQYNADPANVKSVFLFGHVPVPYSGDIVPDGHIPNHQGAWPADGYYGDMDGTWTDNTVNDSGADYARNHNVPGDGKFDQSTFPAPLKLMVGRVDLANMPGALWYGGPSTFPSEVELLRNYLNKDHKFRTKQFDVPRRAIVGDFFGVRNGEAFAASGWRNAAPFFGANNTTMVLTNGLWTPTLASNPYLFAYGAGAGSFETVAGLGNSDTYYDVTSLELYSNDVKAVFTLLFGSWLGDWDSSDNIMRAVLALPSYGLTCAWSGRPHWFMQHMGLGETIGFATRLTQNNGANGLYQNQINTAAGQVHIALMGDPTLRLHSVAPPTNVKSTSGSGSATLTWTAASDSVVGYHVYRANSTGGFTRLTTSPITATSYTDSNASGATNYMVRAVKLETSGSGSYYNPSVGAFLTPVGSSTGIIGGSSTNSDSSNGGGATNINNITPSTNAVPTGSTGSTVWVDDVLPAGAVAGTDGGDAWNWVSSNPTPFSGSLANQSTISAGLHQHYFTSATQTLAVNTGDYLYAYVYIDPANVPSQIMLQWNNGSWEHRAYWGANDISYGTPGTAGRLYVGPLPAAGQWVLLQVPASQLGLEGSTLNGMAFTLSDGRATFDAAGKSSGVQTNTGGNTGTTTGSNTNATSSGSTTNSLSLSNPVAWVDDSLPAGALAAGDGGDNWNWVSDNPTPFSGSKASQSSLSAGLHQHYFTSATQTLGVNSGDILYSYVYLDPANLPTEIMLQWFNGSWEHRAYWGANNIGYGTAGTAGRVYMGPLPTAGQWVLLQVPANTVGLGGSTVNGMAFTLNDGRATWDYAGKASAVLTNSGPITDPVTSTNSTGTVTNTIGGTTNTTSATSFVSWVDDVLPAGAVAGSDGGDAWNWVSSNPTPVSGSLANQSTVSAGLHQHYFTSATQTLAVNSGDVLCAYVYLDPANLPSEIMLQWNNGSWEHRAYWGANNISYGAVGTPSLQNMGPLPTAGQWVLLQVPASQLGLEGSTLNGMSFTAYGGRATWDNAGKASALITSPITSTNSSGSTTVASTNGISLSGAVAWVDDALPTGATGGADGGDSWNWVSSNPAPFSGSLANQSSLSAGLHQHYFTGATQTLAVNNSDVLFAYVYLDPANLPSEIMLQWNNGSWEHRAYWGANNVSYGTIGTPSMQYMGPLPAAGQWTLLQVPATLVGVGGSTLNGMAFSQFDGRATWDYAGKASAIVTNSGSTLPPITSTNGSGGTNIVGSGSNTNSTGSNTNIVGNGSNTNLTGSLSNIVSTITNAIPNVSSIDYVTPQLPKIGDNALHILTPTLLELKLINTKQADPAQVASWNFVNSGNFTAPSTSEFVVTANGQPVAVTSVGFKRRPLYAPMAGYDLRIENSLYLQLAAPISNNQLIKVTNPDGSLWASAMTFSATADPLRFSPAIHVNQEGYMPNYSKQAMVGYYLGNMGEMPFPNSSGFTLVDANTGNQVFSGTLTPRPDSGWTYSPVPYQQVYEADFTAFNTPGEYRLIVPGMGGSLPFLIHDGIAMDFARAYALGLYHQRCGTNTAMPYTRFTHDICHAAPAAVPASATAYPFTWTTVAGYANSLNANNPTQIAPAITSPSTALFPFINQGPVDVSGGHHDAGDYSKYTINSASLIHYLMFAVDSLPGVAALDNLGIPESGDGISDLMQEAKWEADFLVKMQDADGGFYFLVYPQNREYENNVTPDHGDPQVVWPKTTSVTAASVAALAQCASSPLFKRTYPGAAALYLQKAQLGWQFLTNAIAKYGKNGAYQKITHYGDNFADNDEMAWAACQIFLATGDAKAHQMLLSWFDPSDPATWRWGWWHMSECYGHTIRSYAFAVQTGRATASQLDATFLGKCQTQIAAAADDVMNFSQQSAYGTAFQTDAKTVQSAGWYFSADQAFDLAVAYQLNPKPAYMTAMIGNMNYEGGCNPVNVTYITGLGWRRQRDIVSGWALNDNRVLPPSGIPVGNVQTGFNYLWDYAGELEGLCFPSDSSTTAPYPFYDRWGDSWNVTTEMVVLNQARGLGMLAFLAAQGAYKTQPWTAPANATIAVPSGVTPVATNVTLTMSVPGMDLTGARITWEGSGQEPAFGPVFNFTPTSSGTQIIEAEAQWPDGRRAFAHATFTANSPDIVWVDDALPKGAVAGSDGGDSWNWVSTSPAPFSGTVANQSSIAAGEHQDYFSGAAATLAVGTGDVLYAYVYLDPANLPSEIMLQWNDGSSWEHRAYWGANDLSYGVAGTPGKVNMGALPAGGQWVQLKVPASLVGLEGSTVSGLAFTLYGGRATWDAAGRLSPSGGTGGPPHITSTIQPNIKATFSGITLSWASVPGDTYQIYYKNSLSDTTWTSAGQVVASGTNASWTTSSAPPGAQRFFVVTQLN